MRDYGNPSYWDERYAASDGSSFDWYQSYETLAPYLEPFLRKSNDFEILLPGCGNSRLGSDLYDKGYVNITNIDISSVGINQMADKYADKEEMEFTVMDARSMEFLPDDCFNLVIDKGLFDCQLCGEDNLSNVTRLTTEMYRVLKPGGTYLVVSHGLPATRMGYLTSKALDWKVEFLEILKPPVQGDDGRGVSEYHYLYCATKPRAEDQF